jgi:hypothetical protein
VVLSKLEKGASSGHMKKKVSSPEFMAWHLVKARFQTHSRHILCTTVLDALPLQHVC